MSFRGAGSPGGLRERTFILSLLALLCLTGSAVARDAAPIQWSPRTLAAAIEKQVKLTSWQDLETFGQNSLAAPVDERLRRLDYVASNYVWGTDTARYNKWNQILRHQAQIARSRRYVMIADLNDLYARYMKGDVSVMPRFEQVAKADPDWLLRVYAMNKQAYHQTRQDRVVDALKTLSAAEAMIPGQDNESRMARASVLTNRGSALMRVQDPLDSTIAFGRARFEVVPQYYPNPDFSDIYSLGLMATRTGDWALAAQMARIHHALTLRSQAAGIDASIIWDQYLCALVAEHSSPSAVLDCTAKLDLESEASPSRLLAPRFLQIRALAYARLGQLAAARRDYSTMVRLRASGGFPAAAFDRQPLVEAALLRADGHDGEAYDQLMAYAQTRWDGDAQKVRAGVEQLVQEMNQTLESHRRQFEIMQDHEALQKQAINAKTRLNQLAIVVVATILGLLLWQMRIMRQLRLAREAADTANRFKSQFLANMSHEIRTPLNGVVAGADLLTKYSLEPKAAELAEIIRSSSLALQRLISDILDITRIEEGKLSLESAPFAVGPMVRSVSGLFKPVCAEKGLAFTMEIAPDADVTVMGDGLRVRQIITNLINNAIKFTPAGQIGLSVERTDAGLLRYVVTDTGIGFDMADKSKILARFEQADATITRKFGGSGLGLSICRELAALMGGTLDCESAPGAGSRFWVELPLEITEARTAEAEAAAPPVPSGLRILVADDNLINRKLIGAILGDGVVLTSAEDGAQAVSLFQDQAFDLVLMDMQMPVLDGLSAIREIRRLEQATGTNNRVPVVLLTANALPEHIAAAAAAGADLHLAKPFTVASLQAAIAGALAKASAARSDLGLATRKPDASARLDRLAG